MAAAGLARVDEQLESVVGEVLSSLERKDRACDGGAVCARADARRPAQVDVLGSGVGLGMHSGG